MTPSLGRRASRPADAQAMQPVFAARVLAASTAAAIEEIAVTGDGALSTAVQAQLDALDARVTSLE